MTSQTAEPFCAEKQPKDGVHWSKAEEYADRRDWKMRFPEPCADL